MGQTQFLSAVHTRVRASAQTGAILDAYLLADELMAQDIAYPITRDVAVRTVLAASVVYGAPLLLDPGSRARQHPVRDTGAAARLQPAQPARAMESRAVI